MLTLGRLRCGFTTRSSHGVQEQVQMLILGQVQTLFQGQVQTLVQTLVLEQVPNTFTLKQDAHTPPSSL